MVTDLVGAGTDRARLPGQLYPLHTTAAVRQEPAPVRQPASTKRDKMTIRVSEDEGGTWPVAKEIYAGPSAYSALATLPDMTIGVSTNADNGPYETITFARLSLEWITSGEGRGRTAARESDGQPPAGQGFPVCSLKKASAPCWLSDLIWPALMTRPDTRISSRFPRNCCT